MVYFIGKEYIVNFSTNNKKLGPISQDMQDQKEDAMRFNRILVVLAVVFVTMTSSAFAQGRQRAVHRGGQPQMQATVSVVSEVTATGSLNYSVSFAAFTVPVGATIESFTISPVGEKTLIPGMRLTVTQEFANRGWQAYLWGGYNWRSPLPTSWTAGVVSFEVDITGPGLNFSVSHDVKIGDPENKVGPLESAEVYPNGDIFVKGIFPTSPIATFFGRFAAVSAGGWITPPDGFTGSNIPLSVCAGVPLKCSTRVLDIPFK